MINGVIQLHPAYRCRLRSTDLHTMNLDLGLRLMQASHRPVLAPIVCTHGFRVSSCQPTRTCPRGVWIGQRIFHAGASPGLFPEPRCYDYASSSNNDVDAKASAEFPALDEPHPLALLLNDSTPSLPAPTDPQNQPHGKASHIHVFMTKTLTNNPAKHKAPMAQIHVPANSYSYSKLKYLHYGLGSISKLPETVKNLGASRALILTGKSVSKSPIFEETSKALGSVHVASFTDIGQHTPVAGIRAALEILKEKNADTIVALGGGSPIDAAKAISYYRNESTSQGFLKIIAIPTTLSAADGSLTVYTPIRLWLSSGIRALDHGVEALYRQPPVAFPIIELALASIPQLFENLLKSRTDPNNLEVRQPLLNAAYLSLSPNPKPGAFGLSHSLGHKLGATYQIPHGITSCLTLAKSTALKARFSDPYSQENLTRAVKRLEAEAKNILPDVDVEGEPEASRGGAILSKYIEDLVQKLGLRSTLEEWKVPKADLEGIAKAIEKEGLVGIEGGPSVSHVHELLASI
ncbi:alcohol dehydrogenase [Rhizoctonia solani AG-1 IA]|uniref:Alcohol dehydrogenase n=1 Tax=Thanatephorus cucumeris (strain AG1-IA) TaxID=983506 RepID=L8WTU4_THACA|nr:alcohol dehydrogenase [Rhizoctonia solani AG-1 IA]